MFECRGNNRPGRAGSLEREMGGCWEREQDEIMTERGADRIERIQSKR
jgi:hypothetical protein